MGKQFHIRHMNLAEVGDIAAPWAAQEGWNPGLADAACFHAADPDGFFLGLLDDEPVACISAVRYEAHFGFVGFYIVKPGFRGQGYGIQLWKHAMDFLQGRNIGLDGVLEQQDNYRKSGFRLAYSNIRWEGKGRPADQVPAQIVPVSEIAVGELRAYDRRCFPAAREAFLDRWLTAPGHQAFGYREGGALRGYAVLRPCVQGYKIGPLFADDARIAEALLISALSRAAEGSPVYFDTPEVNPAAMRLAESAGMTQVFGTARMYTGSDPDIDLNKVFGVTSFELG